MQEQSGEADLILVVDEDAGTVELLTALLTKKGYRVVGTSDMTQAETLVTDRQFSAVICALQIVHSDGFQLLQKIRTAQTDTGILAMTRGGESRTCIQAAKHLGVAMFIDKPLHRSSVLSGLATVLRERADQRCAEQ